MTPRQGPAGLEEQAELVALRKRADAAGLEVSDTVAALAARIASEATPRTLARRGVAAARRRAAMAARQAAGSLAPSPGAGRARLAAAAGTATGLMMIAAAVLWQHRNAHPGDNRSSALVLIRRLSGPHRPAGRSRRSAR